MPPLPSKLYPRIAIDFFHDVSAGTFPGLALAAWAIRRAAEIDGSGVIAVQRAAGTLWLLYALALAMVVGTGLLRLRYWKLNVRSGFLETKGQMAAIKHALFVLGLVGSGVLLAVATS